jgi:serine phosphatase RsbU (regulator of sigma subunit)
MILFFQVQSQVQPLSRNDKAQVEYSLGLYEENLAKGNWNEASRHVNDVAYIYWEHNQYSQAIKYYEVSLELNKKIGNENGIAMLHNNLGMLSSDIGEYEKSIGHFQKTLAARKAWKNKEGIIAALKNLSVAQNNLGRYKESITDLQEALDYARETNDADQIASCYLLLSETYEKAGDLRNTKHYYDLYRTFFEMKRDQDLKRLQQMADEEAVLKEMAEIQAKKQELQLNQLKGQLNTAKEELFEFDQEKIALAKELNETQLTIRFLETEKENERLKSEEKLREERALRNLFLLGAISLLLLSFFIYRNYTSEKKSKKALAEKNELIQNQNDELESLNAIIAKHNERMQSELNIGKEIQMSMIPLEFPDIHNVDLYANLIPAREVGGDLYDFYQIDDDHLIFGIGDVSDKGVPAALVMAVTKTLIKTNANYSLDPGEILSQVNTQFSSDNKTSMFVSFFLGILNMKTGQLQFSNAGHNPPLVLHQEKPNGKLDEVHGPVIGALESFDYPSTTIKMVKDDLLILYTDGITEAMNEENELYSEERLTKVFSNGYLNSPKDAVKNVIDDVFLFRGGALQSDDITVFCIKYNGRSTTLQIEKKSSYERSISNPS